jgi:outer membrane protein assembly factor BamE (lipoprotein component of BamABCDE complex)
MKKHPFLLFPLFAVFVACAPTVANRGSMLDLESLAQIKPGVTTREQVATRLGTPTTISTFDENVWYYVGRQTEQYSFFSPDVIKQQAVEVSFNDKGIVTSCAEIELPNAADATPVDRSTPTFGQKNTLIRELIGDLKHPRPSMKDMNRGSGT